MITSNETNKEFDRLHVYTQLEVHEGDILAILNKSGYAPEIIYFRNLDIEADSSYGARIYFTGYRKRTEKELMEYDKQQKSIQKEKCIEEEKEKKELKRLLKKYGKKSKQ